MSNALHGSMSRFEDHFIRSLLIAVPELNFPDLLKVKVALYVPAAKFGITVLLPIPFLTSILYDSLPIVTTTVPVNPCDSLTLMVIDEPVMKLGMSEITNDGPIKSVESDEISILPEISFSINVVLVILPSSA